MTVNEAPAPDLPLATFFINSPIKVADSGASMDHGDWRCGGCEAINFRKRTECFKCGPAHHGRQSMMLLPHREWIPNVTHSLCLILCSGPQVPRGEARPPVVFRYHITQKGRRDRDNAADDGEGPRHRTKVRYHP